MTDNSPIYSHSSELHLVAASVEQRRAADQSEPSRQATIGPVEGLGWDRNRRVALGWRVSALRDTSLCERYSLTIATSSSLLACPGDPMSLLTTQSPTRFSLRAALVVLTAVVIVLGITAPWVRSWTVERRIVASTMEIGALIVAAVMLALNHFQRAAAQRRGGRRYAILQVPGRWLSSGIYSGVGVLECRLGRLLCFPPLRRLRLNDGYRFDWE